MPKVLLVFMGAKDLDSAFPLAEFWQGLGIDNECRYVDLSQEIGRTVQLAIHL